MDLILKTFIIAIVGILILFAVYYAFHNVFVQPITKEQAANLITKDLQNSNPGAQINITNITASQYAGSWHVLASVVLNATRPCPDYYVDSFDYPEYGFVSTVENIYTTNCVVYGFAEDSKSNIVASYPVAIAWSYNLTIPSIRNYVSRYGYYNITTHAVFYNSLSTESENFTNVWLVNYTTSRANYSEYALLSQQGGDLLLNYTVYKH